jgi:hypothetical protein
MYGCWAGGQILSKLLYSTLSFCPRIKCLYFICTWRKKTTQMRDMWKKISLDEIVKPHKCNICDAAFSRKRNIEIHISGVYEKKKPYKCLICDGSFTPNDSLSKGLSMFNSRQIIFKKPIIEESHFGRLWKEGASSKDSQKSSVTCAAFENYS